MARGSRRAYGLRRIAVGRTVFWDPLVAWRAKKMTREEAIAEISRRLSRVRGYLREVQAFDRCPGAS